MLKPQFLNLVNSSFLLWLEDRVLSKGSGLQNVSSNFYPVGTQYGKYIYAAPYQPFISNENINQNITPTGIYLSGSFVQRGQSGFVDYDYRRGLAYFSTNVGNYTKVSGNYSISDYQILPLQINEDKLLFETKFDLRPKTNQTITGLQTNSYTYPALYVKSEGVTSAPFAFGGMDETKVNIGIFIFTDSQYSLDAMKSILSDAAHSYVPLLTNFPYNIYGGLTNTGANFNYSSYTNNIVSRGSGLYIEDVSISSFGKGLGRTVYSELMSLNPDIYWSVADFSLCKPRYPRNNTNNL